MRLAVPRRGKRRDPAVVGVAVLRKELEKLARRVARLEGKRRRIGFQATAAIGDTLEQDEDDPDVPDEVP